jgi:HD-GYP domain-containing protein (c-di-GMP phosphodiesterase class II)
MTIDRPYSKGMLLPEALERIGSFVGTRYDKKVVDALVRGCNAGEIGRGVVQFLNNQSTLKKEAESVEPPADPAGDFASAITYEQRDLAS